MSRAPLLALVAVLAAAVPASADARAQHDHHHHHHRARSHHRHHARSHRRQRHHARDRRRRHHHHHHAGSHESVRPDDGVRPGATAPLPATAPVHAGARSGVTATHPQNRLGRHRRETVAASLPSAGAWWADDFAGPAGQPPDPRWWSAEVGGNGWGNQELQTYTAAPANAALDGAGHLAITARPETVTGPDGITRSYTSARLITKTHVDFQYGRLDARIRVPAGRGLLAQLWALGDDVWTAGWPESGEIDAMEVLGERPDTVVGSLHGPLDGGAPYAAWARSTETTAPVSLAAGFHTYSMTWTSTGVSMALDGRTYASYSRSDVPPGGRWVFDKPFFLVLNLAVGGVWPGAPDATTPWPASMLVDWITVSKLPG